MPKQAKPQTPDLTSVRTLTEVKPTALARVLNITPNALQHWRATNRIPAKHLIKVANFYDVEIAALLHLASSNATRQRTEVIKPKAILPAALRAQKGEISIEEAADEAGASLRSMRGVLVNWGTELPTLYEVLEALDEGRISVDQAAQRLNVVKYRVHNIRRAYGYAPGPLPKSNEVKVRTAKQRRVLDAVLRVIAGNETLVSAAQSSGMSMRTLQRYLEAATPHTLYDLKKWPDSFRRAYAEEIRINLAQKAEDEAAEPVGFVEKWLQIADDMRLVARKTPKNLLAEADWKKVSLRRMLIGVLNGEVTLEEVASARGGDPAIIAGLFSSDLRVLDTTYEQVMAMGLAHQMALAEFLTWTLDRARRLPKVSEQE